MLEASLVCKNCGLETDKHTMNVKLEYEDIARGKGAKMKVDEIKDKLITPSKI